MGEVAGERLDQQPVNELFSWQPELLVGLAAPHAPNQRILLILGKRREAPLGERLEALAQQFDDRRQPRRAVATPE